MSGWTFVRRVVGLGALAWPMVTLAQGAGPAAVGMFSGSSDIGATQPGASRFDAGTKSYRLSGGGADLWGPADAFRFTWLQMPGDGSLTADVTFSQPLAFPISKAVLMFRQSLDPGAPYADVAIHGDGHITLQYRTTDGGETKDSTMPEHGPTRIRIERKGDVFTAYAVFADGHLGQPASTTIALHGPVYVGLGVGSHNVHALQTVTFSHVELQGTPQK